MSKKIFTFIFIAILILICSNKTLGAPGLPAPFIPSIHQFYGAVSWPNGSQVNNFLVEAKSSGKLKASTYTANSKYGYNPLFIIEGMTAGSSIEFYLNSVKVEEYYFSNFGFTELNLFYDICGDSYCASTRKESCSSCPADCGSCSVPGTGTGSGSGTSIYDTNTTQNNTLKNKTIIEKPEEKPAENQEVSNEEKPVKVSIIRKVFANILKLKNISLFIEKHAPFIKKYGSFILALILVLISTIITILKKRKRLKQLSHSS